VLRAVRLAVEGSWYDGCVRKGAGSCAEVV
jgi:hypothetical protein